MNKMPAATIAPMTSRTHLNCCFRLAAFQYRRKLHFLYLRVFLLAVLDFAACLFVWTLVVLAGSSLAVSRSRFVVSSFSILVYSSFLGEEHESRIHRRPKSKGILRETGEGSVSSA